MDFALSDRAVELRAQLDGFIENRVVPHERELIEALDSEVAPGIPYPKALIELRAEAKAAGLWNLFLPDSDLGAGLSNCEYGALCESMGYSPVAKYI